MRLGAIYELRARAEARFPGIWAVRVHLAVFLVLFVVFFGINQQLLKLPDTLHRGLSAFPFGSIVYSNAAIHLFPPEVALTDVALINPNLRGAVVRFDSLTIRPELWQLFSGRAAVLVTAHAGEGSATLAVTTGSSFNVSAPSFTLTMTAMPVHTLGLLEQFDPDSDATVSLRAKGSVGLPVSRTLELAASGHVAVASLRNGLAALTFERFRAGVFNFDVSLAGHEAVIRRMDFTDASCSASLNGRIQLNWGAVPDSELDLTAEVKVRPEHIAPTLLLDDNARRRLEQGQALPLGLKGTFRDVQMKPRF